MGDVVVTQEDREAQAQLYEAVSKPGMAEELRAGEQDDHPGVQAFARHRAQARKQALEEAARVAEQEPPFKHGPAITRDAYRMDIAAAIRAIRAIGDKE